MLHTKKDPGSDLNVIQDDETERLLKKSSFELFDTLFRFFFFFLLVDFAFIRIPPGSGIIIIIMRGITFVGCVFLVGLNGHVGPSLPNYSLRNPFRRLYVQFGDSFRSAR